MRFAWFLFALLFFLQGFVYSSLLTPFSMAMQQPERLFQEMLYSDAFRQYESLGKTYAQESFPDLKIRMIQCLFELDHPEKLQILLADKASENESFQLYFKALYSVQKGEFKEALEFLKQIDLQSLPENQKNLIYVQKGFLLEDPAVLELVTDSKSEPLPFIFANLMQAQIYLKTDQSNKAFEHLKKARDFMPSDSMLEVDANYLEGLIHLKQNNPLLAEKFFKKALDQNQEPSLIEFLISSWIVAATHQADAQKWQDIQKYLTKLEKQLFSKNDITNPQLKRLIGHFYRFQASQLGDAEAHKKATFYLKDPSLFISEEEWHTETIKLILAHPSYMERQKLFEEANQALTLSKACRANMLLTQARDILHTKKPSDLKKVVKILKEASSCKDSISPMQAALNLKYLSIAFTLNDEADKGWECIEQLQTDPSFSSSVEDPIELFILAGWVALNQNNEKVFQQMTSLFSKEILQKNERALLIYSQLLLKQHMLRESESSLDCFIALYPASTFITDALFAKAHLKELQGCRNAKNQYLQEIYQDYPNDKLAALAYLEMYSTQNYLEGEKQAIKHLEKLPLLYPENPLSALAYYLIGHSHLKQQTDTYGKTLKKQDLLAAIDAFFRAETLAASFFSKCEETRLLQLEYEARLERAKTHLLIAKKSLNGKKTIYLAYAEELFKESLEKFKNAPSRDYFEKEMQFYLAQTLFLKGEAKESLSLLDHSLESLVRDGLASSFFSFRIQVEMGKIYQELGQWELAMRSYESAEVSFQESIRSVPELKLQLWMDQSFCLRKLEKYDASMQTLSKIINDEVISSKRIEAMILRAELYEIEGRRELAIKQLQAVVRKGGDFAICATRQLEKMELN